MASRIITAEDRKDFVRKVRATELSRWEETEVYKRAEEIRASIQADIDAAQMEMIPTELRTATEAFNVFYRRSVGVRVNVNKGGTAYGSDMRYSGGHQMYLEYLHISSDANYWFRDMCLGSTNAVAEFVAGHRRISSTEDVKAFSEQRQKLARKWYDIQELMSCEINKVVDAWHTIIKHTRTFKSLLEKFPESKQYLPEEVAPPAANTDMESAAKIIRATKES